MSARRANADATAKTAPSIWRFGGLSLWELAKRTMRGYRENQLPAKNAQFAYYSMLALVPLLILLIASITMMPIEGVLGSFLRLLRRAMPPDAYALLESQIHDIQAQSTTTLVAISTVVFAFAGWRLFLTIGEGLNAAFGVPPRHRRIRAHGLSLALTVAIVLLLLVTLVLLVVGPDLMHWVLSFFDLPGLESFLFHFVRWVIVTTCLLISTSVIYFSVPAVRLPWHWFSPGNVFAVAGWMAVSQGFRFYVANIALYNKTYGALGGVIVLLLWLYLTGSMLLVGGQINGVIYRAAGNVELPTDNDVDPDAV